MCVTSEVMINSGRDGKTRTRRGLMQATAPVKQGIAARVFRTRIQHGDTAGGRGSMSRTGCVGRVLRAMEWESTGAENIGPMPRAKKVLHYRFLTLSRCFLTLRCAILPELF